YSAYTLEITPAKVADLDATIDQVAQVIEVQPRDRKRFKRLMEETKSFESLPIRTKLTDEEVARFTAQRFRFTGVDIKAQLFGDRRGALVAIDPRNGEVLAFVSKPNFDPNLFVDGIDADNWKALNESPDKPLLNRALRGAYPPGSTYKPFMALAALTLGKRTPQQAISDPGFFWFGNHKFRDDKEGGHGMVDMYRSIVQSCDTYYYMLANDL